MSIISDAIQAKCLAFSDRIIKLNDYLLAQAAMEHEKYKKELRQRKPGQKTSSILHLPSSIPLHLQSVSNLCNQLLRAGTSIGANNAEACNGISKADFKSKSFIALKEARESLYWIELLHRNSFIDDRQYESIYGDCEELVKVLHHRCKKSMIQNKRSYRMGVATSSIFLLPSNIFTTFIRHPGIGPFLVFSLQN